MTMRRKRDVSHKDGKANGFTLIELLVVISIIALLIGILLPALGAARKSAQSIVCAGNQRSVGQAMMTYTTDGKDLLPPSYVYPKDGDDSGSWRWEDQTGSGNDWYMHWSYMVYGKESGGDDAFTCPSMESGGMPRTWPGDDRDDWQGSIRNTRPDLQAPRMAYAANAALVPRNKFVGVNRPNQLVQVGNVQKASETILVTEFSENTHLVREGSTTSKSHRPITALSYVGGNKEYFNVRDGGYGRSSFFYDDAPKANETFGLQAYDVLLQQTSGALTMSGGGPNVNAVGRHHSGGSGGGVGAEGAANFLFTDGHVTRDTILATLENRQWGDRVYSATGNDNGVYDYNE